MGGHREIHDFWQQGHCPAANQTNFAAIRYRYLFHPYIVMFYRKIGASRWRIANSFSFRLKPTDDAGLSSATIWDMAIGNQN
jgi:hypothetical protein